MRISRLDILGKQLLGNGFTMRSLRRIKAIADSPAGVDKATNVSDLDIREYGQVFHNKVKRKSLVSHSIVPICWAVAAGMELHNQNSQYKWLRQAQAIRADRKQNAVVKTFFNSQRK